MMAVTALSTAAMLTVRPGLAVLVVLVLLGLFRFGGCVAFEEFAETSTAAERHAGEIGEFLVLAYGRGIDFRGVFEVSLLACCGFLAGRASSLGVSSLVALFLLHPWPSCVWRWSRWLSVLGEERVVFNASHKIPEGIWGWVQVVNWSHVCLWDEKRRKREMRHCSCLV
jgi:hypothetical protein